MVKLTRKHYTQAIVRMREDNAKKRDREEILGMFAEMDEQRRRHPVRLNEEKER